MRSDSELTVITKTYDLTLWSCNHTGKFPRGCLGSNKVSPQFVGSNSNLCSPRIPAGTLGARYRSTPVTLQALVTG